MKTDKEIREQYPLGSKFKVIKTGDIKEVGAYGCGIKGILIKENCNDLLGHMPETIEPVITKPKVEGLRMYHFVMYNLSGIQKGIQSGHSAVEYSRKYRNDEEFIEFADNHKTFIVLDGGGSNDMLERLSELKGFGIKFAEFYEPDLNNSLSAISFILPESIYDMDLNEEFDPYGDYDDAVYSDFDIAKYIKGFRLASN